MELDKYPKELIATRDQIESGFIFSLWNNPDAIDEYKNDIDIQRDIKTSSGKFYYGIALGMYGKQFRSFDEASIYTYLSDKETLLRAFENKGGMNTVNELREIFENSTQNLESYYDELIKGNALMELHDEGYDVLKYIDKIKHMQYSDLEDFMEYKLNNIFLKSASSGMTTADLTSNYESWIDKWDTGEGVGYRVGFPLLNYHLAGIHKKNLILHLGGIGQGKTTTALLFYVLSVLESGEKIAILANEQDEEQFRQMLLATVLFNRINYFDMNRQKLLFGGFTDNDKLHLKKASQWLEQYKDKLHYVHLTDYGSTNIKRLIKKYSKLGVGIFLVDTLKPSDESSDKAWAEFSETAKMLFQMAQKEDVAIVATAQLSSESSKRKFLDLSCIGKSRAIAETAGQVIMFRSLKEEEKKKLFVYTHMRDANGKYLKTKKQHELDEKKDYIVVFIPKNRYGGTDIQIVYERNMNFNFLKEIGYTHIEYDGFGK